MTHRGLSHIGLSTLDLDKTRAFYEGVLGFKPVVAGVTSLTCQEPTFTGASPEPPQSTLRREDGPCPIPAVRGTRRS
jgi:catechol 2,3-dioxygenase-like lactoylglutathione lyase family enzyme